MSKTMSDTKMQIVRGLDSSERKQLIQSLNSILADEYALFTQTLNYHWNVKAPQFKSLHQLFEEQYRQLLTTMDEVAERVRILDGHPLSTVEEMRTEMSIKENPGKTPDATKMLMSLLESHLNVTGKIEEVLSSDKIFDNDKGSEDFLVSLLRDHQMMAWMLKSHLE